MDPLPVALERLMRERGISVRELSVRADLGGVSGVYRYLSGERGRVLNKRSLPPLQRIASALGVRPDYFAEYRVFVMRAILRKYPDLDRDFYDLLVERARLRGFGDDAIDEAD